jgi:hypothetical protein
MLRLFQYVILSSTGGSLVYCGLAKECMFFVDVHQRRCKNDSHLNGTVGAGRLPFKEVIKELIYLMQVLQAVPYLRKLDAAF